MKMPSVVVIGAGIAGLSTAIVLAEQGFQVNILAREPSSQTTSAVAAAFWYPYKAYPEEKVAAWGAKTFEMFESLATISSTGVKWMRLVQITDEIEPPWWSKTVRDFSAAAAEELPIAYASGIAFDTFVIDSSVYLPFLNESLNKRGVSFFYEDVGSLNAVFQRFGTERSVDYVVNCSGLGARSLANDNDLHAARGQVVRIKKGDDDKAFLDAASHTRFAHCIPRISDTILGGTYEERVEDPIPSSQEIESIITRCQSLMPRLKALPKEDILQVSCGFRPVRSSVRLEKEEVSPGKFVFHNYGHGGAGYTLSWGCALAVLELMQNI
ncbi:MAG TPA: FAD-dependent oxidoreductase [Oculatellaceae cyanobacterium]